MDKRIVAVVVKQTMAVGGGWRAITYVSAPDDGALLALAARLCEKSGR